MVLFSVFVTRKEEENEVLQSTAEVAKDKYYVDCYPVWET